MLREIALTGRLPELFKKLKADRMARLERIIERLELKEFQLKALLEVTKAINDTEDRAALLGLYERIIREDLGITRLMLFEHVGTWERILAFGNDLDSVVIDIDSAVGSFTDIQVIGSESTGSLGAFDIAVPVYHRNKPLAFLLIGDIDEEEQRMSPTVKHLNFIQTLTNLIVVALENRRLAKQELAEARAKARTGTRRGNAEHVGAAGPTEQRTHRCRGWYQPHSEVGGDYYDLIALHDGTLRGLRRRRERQRHRGRVVDEQLPSEPTCIRGTHHGPRPIGTRPQRQGACKCARRTLHHPVHRHHRYLRSGACST